MDLQAQKLSLCYATKKFDLRERQFDPCPLPINKPCLVVWLFLFIYYLLVVLCCHLLFICELHFLLASRTSTTSKFPLKILGEFPLNRTRGSWYQSASVPPPPPFVFILMSHQRLLCSSSAMGIKNHNTLVVTVTHTLVEKIILPSPETKTVITLK